MKFYKSMAAVLAAAIMVSGCATKAGTVNPEDENSVNDRIVSEEIEEDKDDTEDEEISEDEESADEESEQVSEYYSFNPYVYSDKITELRGDKFWKGFYNMIDAVRAGEDSFECPDEDTYWQVMDPFTFNQLYPIGCVNVTPILYEDGKGRILYQVPKEEFKEKREKFEEEITSILHETVKTDYSDFEKCLSLYVYMCENYDYAYEELEGDYDFSEGCVTTTFNNHRGICNELSGAYSYLLLQCGVDALSLDGVTDGHAWPYVMIDGEGYYCDPTWALKSDQGDLYLWEFLTTESYRQEEGLHPEDGIFYLFYDYTGEEHWTEHPADDDRYADLWLCAFDSLDTENNIVYCHDFSDGTAVEFKYED